MDPSIQNLVSGLGQLNLSQNGDREQAYAQIASALADAAKQAACHSYKAPKPQLFHGGRDALATRDWLEQLERYCKRTTLPPTEWTSAAIDHLRGTALTWFRMSHLRETTPWDAFKTEFTKEFKPSDHEHSILMELRDLKQASVKEISAYINRFRDLALQLDNPADDMLREYFIAGLVEKTQIQVQIANPDTWQEAVKVAERINGVYARALAKSKPTYMTTPTPNQSALPPAEPMDVDSMRVLLANLASLTNAGTTVANFRRHNKGRLPKLDKKEKERCLRLGLCFRCRKKGHMAEGCTGDVAMYSIEADDDNENDSGKEQGEL